MEIPVVTMLIKREYNGHTDGRVWNNAADDNVEMYDYDVTFINKMQDNSNQNKKDFEDLIDSLYHRFWNE